MQIKTEYLSYSIAANDIPSEILLSGNGIPKNKTYFFFKRAFEILVSFFFIVFILSWFLPIIALLIKLDSEGPVFFLQKRMGKGSRFFSCIKLRTMFVNEFADDVPATENDQRITRIGRILRRSNLDEFPQFFNILLGNMSLIGPRPHMATDYYRFSSIIPEYHFRNFVRPGITGLAQVRGLHGPASNFDSIYLRYQYDAFYVRNANFQLDLRILKETATRHIKSIWIILMELI